METKSPNWAAASLVVAVGLFTLLGFVAVASYAISAFPGRIVDLPMVVIAGVIALLGAVAFTVVAYSFFGLHDRQQALGLPEGSVRALVAMMLLIIFAIFAVYFFDRLDTTAKNGQADFAKQVIALIGTLLTAVVSFYFASRGATEAMQGTPLAPVVNGIDPKEAKAGESVWLRITGLHLLTVTGVRLTRGTTQLVATDVKSAEDQVNCRIYIPSNAEKGGWDVVIDASPNDEGRLSQAFQIL